MAHETRVKQRSRPSRRSYTAEASRMRYDPYEGKLKPRKNTQATLDKKAAAAKPKQPVKATKGKWSKSGGGGGGFGGGMQFDKATGRWKRVKHLK